MYTFDSFVTEGAELSRYDTWHVKNEPMFFSASPDFAYDHGGPITKQFLDRLTVEPVAFDSKVAMLMPGWWPCIPGWHHDDVPRSGDAGQPDYDFPGYRSKHAFAIVGDDICRTEFALGTARFPRPRKGEIAYGVWDPIVDSKIATRQLEPWVTPMEKIIYFDDRSWHRGVQATGVGWRWFGRASWNTDRPVTNELRFQVQVYLENPKEGW